MPDPTLLDRLEALLREPTRNEEALSLAHIETTLTDGYARALALGAERSRLARRIGELAAYDGVGADEKTRELTSLSHRLAAADGDLSRLRRVLSAARSRVTAARSAAAPA